MEMLRAVEEMKRSTKDVDNKLNMLEWKVETLVQNNFITNQASTEKEPVNIGQFLKDVNNVKMKYTTLKNELKEVFDKQKESMDLLTNKMDVVSEKFVTIAETIGESDD